MWGVRSGIAQSSDLVSFSCTANLPWNQRLRALPDSSQLRAREGLVEARGVPLGSRTGTEIWLCGEMCLVMVSLLGR